VLVFIEKKTTCYIIILVHFSRKKNQSLEKFFFPCIFFDHVIIKPLPPTHLVIKHHHLANPPTHLFDDVILECPLTLDTLLFYFFPKAKSTVMLKPCHDLLLWNLQREPGFAFWQFSFERVLKRSFHILCNCVCYLRLIIKPIALRGTTICLLNSVI